MYPLKLLICCVVLCGNAFSQTGKDGAEIIASSNVIFNRYDKLASSAVAGDFSITVNNIANLSGSAISGAANNPYATDAITSGDLLMIIKMQGATINTTATDAYGSITAYNNAGVYELVAVQSVSGNTMILSAALANSFVVSTTQRVQVVRLPRLSSLTINAGASLIGQAWGSSYTGGIVAVEVTGNAFVNGTINADGIGFRGGAIDALSSTLQFPITAFVGTTGDLGAEKGESIAGYQADYDALNGRYCKGAPANGGGGGNAHNAGGGGGANAGNPAGWSGKGTPDNSGLNWYLAWNLEGSNFSSHTSTGGGRGGYTFSARDKVATTLAPGDNNWGGDDRRNEGGLGGRPLNYSPKTLFMGGGGGAGDQNQGWGTAGGNGGGIIFLTITGTLSGSGSITANGVAGADVTGISAASNGIDAAGGGGAGGAIKLNVLGAISGVGLYAKGGNGGSQRQFNIVSEAEGPGGGGGGGYIAVTGTPSITMNSAGGVNGTTNSSALTEFLPNGATMGGVGSGTTNITYDSPPPAVYLPLTFKSFDLKQGQRNMLDVTWTVAKETNVARFDLEQSYGDGRWMTIATELVNDQMGLGKLYSISINKPVQTSYYRLKMYDRRGSFEYSVVKVYKVSGHFSIKENTQVIEINQPGVSDIKLFNSFGQEVVLAWDKSLATVRIDKSRLAKGIYYIVISSAGTKQTYRFIR